MIGKPMSLPIVEFSVRLYRLFLVAYPAQFQKEYGLEMTQVFHDCCLRTVRQSGMHGMIKLWLTTLIDLVQSVLTEHMQKETQMKQEMKPEDIRRAGWALILGGISFTVSLLLAILETRNWSELGLLVLIFVSLPLLVFGVLGLRSRYGEKTGSFGKNILLIGTILGPITSLSGFFVKTIDPLWLLTWAGPAVLLLCLTLFGITALNTQPLPRWNILPVLGGLFYPAVILFQILSSLATGDWSGTSMPSAMIMTLITIQGIALLALGYILKSDVPEQAAAMA